MNKQIIKIIVELSNNNRQINYYVDTREKRECYTEKNIPASIVELMNKNTTIYHDKKVNGIKMFIYKP